MPPSRASPLPQWISSAGRFPVGASLLAMLFSVESRTAHRRTTFREEQTLQFGARAFGAHEGFTNQERVHIADFHQLDIGPVENAALGNHQAITRNARQQVEGVLDRK